VNEVRRSAFVLQTSNVECCILHFASVCNIFLAVFCDVFVCVWTMP